MKNLKTILLAGLATTGLALATDAAAAKTPDPVACSVRVDYLINGTVRAPFTHAFIVTPGTVYDFDFSTFTRFRYFQAKADVDPATGISTVMINYYNDVGVFTFVELGTTVAVRNNNDQFTNEGKSTFFTSLGTAGEHTTDYALSCGILK